MKILQVMPDFELAGAQTMLENLVMELKKIDENEILICSFYNCHSKITERLENEGFKIIYLNKKRGFDPFIIGKIKKIIDSFKPDIIHTHRYSLEYVYPAFKKSKFNDLCIIHTIHNIANKEVPKWLSFFQKKLFKNNKVVPVAISPNIKKSVVNYYKLDSTKVPMFCNGVNLQNCIVKKRYRKKAKIILHIGRFSEAKNHEGLIDIFNEFTKRYNDIYLYLIGTGKLYPNIKEKVDQLNLNNKVKFLGNQGNCYKYLNEADIFVLLSKYEGMPMTIIESMGTGLPIVASPVGGVSDIITNEVDGFLPSTPEETVNTLSMLINDGKLCKKIGLNAKKKSINYSSVIMAKDR